MKKCKFVVILIISSFTSITQAQCLIEGKVVDERNNEIPYVNVRLLHTDSIFIKGTVADSTGCYELYNVPGDYLIAYSCTGYISQCIPLKIQNKERQTVYISLRANDVALGEVLIKGESFIRKKDHVLIFPNKEQIKHATTGYDLLYNLMIPGISVDRRKGSVKSLGEDASLYIDGRKVDYREIQSLRPRDIEKIEYFDVPTGKYAGDVTSINYITKQYKTGGYVSLDADQSIGYLKGDYNAVAKLNKGNTNYTLFAGYQMQEYDGVKKTSHEVFNFTDYNVIRDSKTIDAKSANNNQYGQLHLLNKNEKRTLAGKLSFVHTASPDDYQINQMIYSGRYNFEQYSHSEVSQRSIMPGMNLYGNFKIKDNQQLEVSLNGIYTHNDYTRNYTENNFLSSTDVKEDFYNMDGNINYNIALKHNNSLSMKLYHLHKISSSTYQGDYSSWQHLWSGETLLFVEYNQQFSNNLTLRFRPGVSSLQYHLYGNEYISHVSPRLQMGINFQPAKRQYIQINLNIGNSYPQINTINKMDQTIDLLQIKRGNPDMDKTNLYLANAIYAIRLGKFNTQLVIMYLYADNMIVNNYYLHGDKLINSFQDGSNYHDFKINLSTTWKMCDNLNAKIDLNYIRQVLSKSISFKNRSFLAELNINYFWKNIAFNVYGKIPYYVMDDWLSLGHAKVYGDYGLSVSWNNKNWRVESGTNSPFTKSNKLKEWLSTDVYSFNTIQNSRTYQQTGYIKIAYTFDFGRKTSREQNNINKSVNSAIMKAY